MESSFNNTPDFTKRADGTFASPYVTALLCLLAAVVLLSSITPAIKYVFQHSDLHPIVLATLRVTIGFFVLMLSTMVWDRGGAKEMAQEIGGATVPLALLGLLGVASYAVAACGLLYTSVTHYILIYSLMPTMTAIFSCLCGKEPASPFKALGILLSLVGCLIAVWDSHQGFGVGSAIGDGLVLLFTMMMAAYIVLSSSVVRHVSPLPANTLMFGSSALGLLTVMVLFMAMGWAPAVSMPGSPLILVLVIYVGVATAAVFLFRYISQRALSPMTVGVYHNLIPVLTIAIACLCFGEALQGSTIVGGSASLPVQSSSVGEAPFAGHRSTATLERDGSPRPPAFERPDSCLDFMVEGL